MIVPGWLMLNLYALIMGHFICAYSSKHTTQKILQTNVYRNLTVLLMILIAADSMGRIVGDTELKLFILKLGNFLIFLLDPFIGFLIIKYVDSWSIQVKTGQKIIVNIIEIIALLNIIFVTLSSAFDFRWFYHINDKGEYFRGHFYIHRAAIVIGIVFFVELYVVLYRKYIDMRYKKTMIYFPLMPFVFGVLQILIEGYALEYCGMMLTCVLLFVYVQSKSVDEDFLTKTMNKRYFDSVLDEKIENFKQKGTRFGIVMIDLDYFKKINDSYGHVAGDQALIKISEILKTSFRKSDTICRFGGDEFCVLLDVEDDTEIQRILNRVKVQIDEFNKTSDTYKLSISAGHLIYEDEKESSESFLKRADDKMYIKKEEKHKKFNLTKENLNA